MTDTRRSAATGGGGGGMGNVLSPKSVAQIAKQE